MKKIILTFIFIPPILLFALFFWLHLATYSFNAESSLHTFWRAFTNVWYKSVPLYALITLIFFYIILIIQVSKQQN